MAVLTMVQAINQALAQEMRKNQNIIILGEDVGINGGVFRATENLYKEFGLERVIDTPLSESGILGIAIGMALYGLRPVPEIQFMDFVYPAFDQIISEMAKMRYRSGGQYNLPMVLRMPYGGGIRGGLYHSQSAEAYFAHTAGLKVVIPSNPYDAKGLLLSALREEDPIIFLEPKRLYRSTKEEVPEDDYTVPIGKSKVVKEGSDLSIYSYGAMIPICLEASNLAKNKNISVEIIDIMTLVPLDTETILKSVEKTGRAIIVHEAPKTCGYGAEISALIAENAIESLQAPIIRVTGFDTPFPYALEHLYLPDSNRILNAIEKVMSY